MDTKLNKQMQSLKKSIEEKEVETMYQMPLWGHEQRAIPNDFARSALFSATKGTGGQLIDNEKIFSQNEISLYYKGKRLTQDHLDVYSAVMHLYREVPEGNDVRFTEHSLLKIMDRKKGGTDHNRLVDILTDLTATSLTIKHNTRGKVYWGSLLPEGASNPENGTYRLKVSRTLAKFFSYGYVTVEQKKRKLLARSPLAKYMQNWILSHKTPYPVTIEYLHNVSGSKAKNMKSFKQRLTSALDKLVEINVIESWEYKELDGVQKVIIGKLKAKPVND